MSEGDRKVKKERQVAALERIESKLGFDSRAKMAKTLGISETTLSDGFNRSNARMMGSGTRKTVAEGLGRHCKSEEELCELVEETEWEMTDEEWERALNHITSEEDGLHEVPRLSEKQMVGRGDEIDELQRWLRGERGATERIMVVQGIGGIGKTTLVIRAVRDLDVGQWYRDGVYWVRMTGHENDDGTREFARQVMGSDALREQDVWRAMGLWLKGKRVLVVLDEVNERIGLDGWGDVLPARGRLLVTSRVTGLEGARIECRTLKVGGLGETESFELLTRGIEVDVNEDELEWVVNELGGLPLALRLGNHIGRQIKGLKGFVEGLRTEGLGALSRGKRKEESMRVMLEQSYELLDERDQTLFRGLGIFPPWFEVKHVAAVLGLREGVVRMGLWRLQEKGLVESLGAGKYEMHHLIHRRAVELCDGDEKSKWQGQFAEYYLGWAQKVTASGDVEMLADYLGEIERGILYASGLRRKECVMAYLRCIRPYLRMKRPASQSWAGDEMDKDERARVMLRTAQLRLELGKAEDALELARGAQGTFGEARCDREWVQATLIEGDALLWLGHVAETMGVLKNPELWKRVVQLPDGDERLFRVWVLSERARVDLGQDHKEQVCWLTDRAETARARWMAGQSSSERAELRLLRSAPVSNNPDKATQALEERMGLAEKVQDQNAWLTDALRCSFLLARQGKAEQAEAVLLEADRRKSEMKDARFNPWVNLLEAHVAWALGRDEGGERAYKEAAEELASVFGEMVLWQVPVEEITGETTAERAVEVWRRALRVEDPFRYVEAVCKVYPVFVRLGDELLEDKAEREKQYKAAQEEWRWMGVDLPDLAWFIEEEDDDSGAGNEAGEKAH